MMFRAASRGRVTYPAPSAPCENPGLKPRRVSQLPRCNESPGNADPSHSQALNSRRGCSGCSSHHKAQLDPTLGRGTSPVCIHGALHGLLVSGRWVSLGREFGLFWCFGTQNVQVTSFSCVSQRTYWLNGAAGSLNLLSLVSLCHNFCVV